MEKKKKEQQHVERLALLEKKIHYKTYYENTIVWCQCKNSQANLWDLKKDPEIGPNLYEYLVYDQDASAGWEWKNTLFFFGFNSIFKEHSF